MEGSQPSPFGQNFGVSIDLPPDWTITACPGCVRAEGPDGFVEIAAANGSGSAMAVAARMVGHHLDPYGNAPELRDLVVERRSAVLVVPSDDAPVADGGVAAGLLLAEYPEPLVFGGETYRFASISIDVGHLESVAASLRWAST